MPGLRHRHTHTGTEPPRPELARKALLTSTEGRMLRIGLLLGAVMVAALGIVSIFSPELTLVFAAMTGLNWLIGRAAGMSFGYANDLTHATVIPANMLIETIQVLVVYPLFVLSLQNLLDLPKLKPLMARLQGSAEARRQAVSRFGIAGLFVFVFMPFWMTGPVVGAIIGFLIGLRPSVNIAVVLSSTYVAIGLWGLLLNELSDWAGTYNRLAPFALVVALALIAFGGGLVYRRRAA